MSDNPSDVAELQALLNDRADELFNAHARQKEAERRLAIAQIWREPTEMAALAMQVARDIEDAFARGYDGGHFASGTVGPVEMRRNVIAGIVRRAIDAALIGGKPEFI